MSTEQEPECEALKKLIELDLRRWLETIESREYAHAAKIAIDRILLLRHGNKLSTSPLYSEFSHGCLVFFNGLRDVANLYSITAHPRWISTGELIEKAWLLAHNAKDRLLYSLNVDDEFLEVCMKPVDEVLDTVHEQLGPGLYSSWELLVDGLDCSLCKNDIRGCHHTPGEFYDGQRCTTVPSGGHIRAVSLVTNPDDPRCRIWPWHEKPKEDGHRVFEAPIYIIFEPEGSDDDSDNEVVIISVKPREAG